MSWIESHQTLPGHPKLARLAAALKIHKGMAFWHLHNLWYWALDYAQDGQTKGSTDIEIADGAKWTRSPDVFVKALRDTGWIDKTGYVHDWHDYAGKLVQARADNAARMRAKRNNARAPHVQDTCTARAPATGPYPTGPYPTEHTPPSGGSGGGNGAEEQKTQEPFSARSKRPVRPWRGGIVEQMAAKAEERK